MRPNRRPNCPGAVYLGLALLLIGCRSTPPQQATTSTGASEPWVRTELYFGLSRPDGTTVTGAEWADFLNASVTPRFPDGLTVVQGHGRYRSQDQRLHEEPTNVLIILHPRKSFADSDRKVRELCSEYIRRFDQESVLRSDSMSDTSFITAVRGGVVQEPAGDMPTRNLSK